MINKILLLLILLFIGCGVSPKTNVSDNQPNRDPKYYDFGPGLCEELKSDPINGTGIWSVDCMEYCVPPEEFYILCHQGLPPHLFLADPNAKPSSEWAKVFEEPNTSCVSEKQYRVFNTKIETLDWGELDVAALNSWVSNSYSECIRDKINSYQPANAISNYFELNWNRKYYVILEERGSPFEQ